MSEPFSILRLPQNSGYNFKEYLKMFIKFCQGIVTSVDPVFCCFVLNNSIQVHMSIYLSQNNLNALPDINSKVFLENAHASGSEYVVCKCSIFIGKLTVSLKLHSILGIVKKLKLGAADIFMLAKIMRHIDENFTYNVHLKMTLISSICEYLKTVFDHKIEGCLCLNKVLDAQDIITINFCRHVEIISNKYNTFPHWSFGIHSKPKENTILFSYLTIEQTYGFLILKDAKYQMPCIIYDATNQDIQSLVCCHLLIKSYKVVTEIFSENIPNLEYILIKFNDIVNLYQLPYSILDISFDMDISRYVEFKFNMHFVIIRKSMTCIGSSGKPEIWLQILIHRDVINHTEMAVLILPSRFVKHIIYFKENQHYKLFYNLPLKEKTNCEISRTMSCKVLDFMDKKIHFEVLDQSPDMTRYLTVEECKQYIAKNTDLISFIGVLKAKNFANTLPSRTKKHSSIYGFGTPGSKTHQLVFSCIKNDTVVYLDCYLTNWENILMPLGLIPQMKIAVKNVYPQSKKYLKSSIFTSFEILSYEPLIDFCTVNLYEYDDIDWGPRFFLGHGDKIPYDVVVWGKALDVEILSIKICTKCKNCNYKLLQPGRCSNCACNDKQLDFLLIFYASDEMGQSKIIVKEVDFLKALLNIHERQFPLWIREFEMIGSFQFNIFEEEQDECYNNSSEIFKNVICDYLRTINTHIVTGLNLKCRKLDSNPKKNDGLPLWFCIDVMRC